MRVAFIEKKFKPQSLVLIDQINEIMAEYEEDGYDLSLRQLYYALVSRDIVPNNFRSYKSVGNLVNDARMAGLLDWDTIVDRGRETKALNHWSSPSEILEAVAEQFRIDKWLNQPNYVEVMVEKDALSGVVGRVCNRLDVSYTANKGYSSQSFMYRKGVELQRVARRKSVHVLYLGDHDPSGLDMDRDIEERLGIFSRGARIRVVRLALTMDQVEEHNPPPNFAKSTDVRARGPNGYISRFGEDSWELDALEPRVLDRVITTEVERLRDQNIWDADCARQQHMRDDLQRMADEYYYEEPEDDDGDDEDDEE